MIGLFGFEVSGVGVKNLDVQENVKKCVGSGLRAKLAGNTSQWK